MKYSLLPYDEYFTNVTGESVLAYKYCCGFWTNLWVDRSTSVRLKATTVSQPIVCGSQKFANFTLSYTIADNQGMLTLRLFSVE